MDLATIIGIIAAFGLIFVAIFMGGGVTAFINVPSVMIVVGGTIGVGLINYPLKEIIGSIGVAKNAFLMRTQTPKELIQTFVDFAYQARRDGILALESKVREAKDPFLAKGIQLAIDGQEATAIENIMHTEIAWLKDRHKLGAEIFSTLGTFAPAMGLIGTLIGLIQMLQNLDDPSTIGPAMAMALLTTFYGAILANVVFMPISGKLKTRSSQEALLKELVVEGVISISAGENPRILEQKLHAFLAPKQRESVITKK